MPEVPASNFMLKVPISTSRFPLNHTILLKTCSMAFSCSFEMSESLEVVAEVSRHFCLCQELNLTIPLHTNQASLVENPGFSQSLSIF